MFIRGNTRHFVSLEKYLLFVYYWICKKITKKGLSIVRLEVKSIENLVLVPNKMCCEHHSMKFLMLLIKLNLNYLLSIYLVVMCHNNSVLVSKSLRKSLINDRSILFSVLK